MENEKMRIADRFGVKLLVFLLCTACFAYGAYMAVQATHALDWNNNPLLPTTDPRFVLAKGGYATSDLFVQAVDGDVNELYTMATTSKSDAYIDSGAATAEDLDAMLRGVYDGLAASCAGAVPGQLSGGYQIDVGGEPQTFGYEAFLASDAFIVREEWDAGGGTVSSSRGWEEAGVREAFRALYSEQVKAVEEGLKALRKQELRNFQARLDEQGLLYFATDGANTLTNVPALAKSTALDAATQDALDALGAPVSYRFSKAGGELTASAEGTLSEIGGVADRLFPYGQDAVSQVLSDPYWAPSTPFPVPEGTALFVAYTDAYFAAHDAALERVRDAYRTIALPAAAAWVACLVLCVMLLVWTGRKRAARAAECRPYKDEASIVDVEAASCRPYKDEASIVDVGAACSRPPTGQPSYRWDRCPMELQIILIALCVGVAAVTMRAYAIARIESNAVYSSVYWPAGTFGDVLFCGAMAALFALGLWCLTSLVRNGAAGTFAARSGVCLGAAALGRGVALLAHTAKTGFDGTNPLAKTVVLVAAFWLVTSIFAGGLGLALRGGRGEIPVFVFAILLVAVLALALWFTVRWARRYARLKQGVEAVSAGDVGYQIEVPEGSTAEFDALSLRVNAIGAAIGKAIESELRQQRLKTDLISNVSHDLKTPLTSILTYTDLLKKEGLKSKRAEEYLAVIDEKGQRLRKLTEDLFDAAKASSGAMPVRRERVDLAELVRQALAEAEEGFAAAGLDVIVNAGSGRPRDAAPTGGFGVGGVAHDADEAGDFTVTADGNLLWRVLDNLLGNVRKYALEGSRVYVDLRRADAGFCDSAGGDASRVVLEIKNVSAAKLNIAADELMERFTRGDENRATEGSGLGLAIARDLTRLMDGAFDVVIDGDLFKVVLAFP